MDRYKKIITSQALRMKILKMLEWIPDSSMIRLQYRIKMGRRLNLNNALRFTEKIQWYKLYYRDPLMTTCVDKHSVRSYIIDQGMERYLIPELGVWETPEDIDWEKLPDSFVLKTTNGSETNIFVKDRKSADKNAILNQLKKWLTQTNINYGREWAYNNVKPRIICEPIINSENQHGKGLDDYKFFCFNGKIGMMWIDYDRFGNHKRVLYDREGNRLNVACTYDNPKSFIYPQKEFETLIPIAEKLAKPFPHARIDLYYVKEKPYFGEITFYSGSGYEPFDKDEYDRALGNLFVLPQPKGVNK